MKNDYPELIVHPITKTEKDRFDELIKGSLLNSYGIPLEIWTSNASSHALSYSTHGIFRYFGKFPPPIASYLIKEYTSPDDLVLDPMCGSGTTAVEASLLGRKAICNDVNPLAVAISKAKITKIGKDQFEKYLNEIITIVNSNKDISPPNLIGLRNPDHWFLPETINSLNKIRSAIEELEADKDIKNVFNVIFLSIVRRVSRATTQQGRLFLDVVTAELDALPFFIKKAERVKDGFANAPESKNISIQMESILNHNDSGRENADLVICHPPYFNNYKYSGVNSLELSWMKINHASVRKSEVREAFKVGKKERVENYISDMEIVLRNIANKIKKQGHFGLMIGDTFMKGEYIPVTKMLLDQVKDIYQIERIALRIPKFTEASWAASQRRKGNKVGITMCDFVICLRKYD